MPVSPGGTAERSTKPGTCSSGTETPAPSTSISSGRSARGPTKLMSPRKMFQSCGSSSIAVARSTAPDARDARVAFRRLQRSDVALGVGHHRAELEHVEVSPALADARLPEEDGPGAVEPDRGRDDQPERRRRRAARRRTAPRRARASRAGSQRLRAGEPLVELAPGARDAVSDQIVERPHHAIAREQPVGAPARAFREPRARAARRRPDGESRRRAPRRRRARTTRPLTPS